MKLQKKDLKMIQHLRTNARMPLTEMSKKTGIPVSTLFDRLKMHTGGLIKKHTTLLNFEELGFNTRATIVLKVAMSDRDRLRGYLTQCGSVNSVFKINSGYDFMIDGVFKHIKDAEDFVEKLETEFAVEQKHTFYVLDELQREEFDIKENSLN